MGRQSPILPAHKLEEALAAASQQRRAPQQEASAQQPSADDGPAAASPAGGGMLDVLGGANAGDGGDSLATSAFGSLLRSMIEAVVLEPVVAFCVRPRGGHWAFLQARGASDLQHALLGCVARALAACAAVPVVRAGSGASQPARLIARAPARALPVGGH
jgi:hypothetical protein